MRLPIGYDDFRALIDQGFDFVDKSLFIKDIINDDSQTILITRPRRFGKTLNLSMLHYFFAAEAYSKNTQGLFNNLKIAGAGEYYTAQQGKYPVIFLTLKDIKDARFNLAYEKIHELMVQLYDEFAYLEQSGSLSAQQKEFFRLILNRKANPAQLAKALQVLTQCLAKHHGVNPILLIDEYDTPIQSGYIHGYYEEIIDFVRGFLSSALKTNPYLHKAVLTGILRVSKESLFSDLNNIDVYSVLSTRYSEYFGFTETEVGMLLEKTGLQHQANDIRAWYNGYQIGDTVIYNPWSIVNCLKQQGKLQAYWSNTSGNDLIKKLLIQSKTSFKAQFELLLRGESIERFIDERLVFQYLDGNETAVWSLLLAAGYLKVVACEQRQEGLWCHLQIPNQEIRGLYQSIIEQWLSQGESLEWYYEFLNDLLDGRLQRFEQYLQTIYEQIISVHDIARYPEAFCHALILGLTASLHPRYEIKSNKESGVGRYDLAILPQDKAQFGIIMEFKIAQEKNNLEKTAQLALTQINTQHYATEFKTRGLQKLIKIGIAFHGKYVRTVFELEIF